jgi:tetratricopeptide (TPR) repeat protein
VREGGVERVERLAVACGSRLGSYRLERELGRGGQGRVFFAIDERLGRPAAVKVLEHASTDALGRFSREATAASRLDHPGVAAVYEVGRDQGRAFIAMRYVEGESLARKLGAARRTSEETEKTPSLWSAVGDAVADRVVREEWPRTLRFVEGAARALHAAHERGVVHRDVKPGNLMATPDGEPVVLDFGLAGLLDDGATELTRSGEIFGTPGYMAPEQVAPGRAKPDRRTDVYALGVVLFEALTLRRPFERATRDAVFTAILTADPPDLRAHLRGAPEDLRTVVEKCLEKEPWRRYETALALAEDLRRVREGEPVLAQPPGAAGRLARFVRRRPAAAALIAVLAAGAPVVGGLAATYAAERPLVEARRAAERAEAAEARLDEGFFRLQLGDVAGASASFAAARALAPTAHEATVGYALGLVLLREPSGAARAAQWLDALPEPERTEAAPLRAAALFVSGNTEAAEALRRVARPASTPFGWFVRALDPLQDERLTASRPRRSDLALRDAAWRAVLTSPVPRRLHYGALVSAAARAAMNGDDDDRRQAVAAMEAATTRWPEDAHVRWQEGLVRAVCEGPAAAVAPYRLALKLLPPGTRREVRASFVGNLANALAESGGEAEALELFRGLVRDEPEFAAGHLGLVALCQRLGRTADAVDSLLALTNLRPEDATNWLILGTLRLNEGRAAEAVVALRRAAALRPDHADTRHNLSNALSVAGEPEAAEREQEAAVRLAPEDLDAALGLARRKYETADLDGADAVLSEAAKRFGPERATAVDEWRRRVARRRDQLERLDEVRDGADEPESPQDATDLGGAATSARRYREAARMFDAAASGLDPREIDAATAVAVAIGYLGAALEDVAAEGEAERRLSAYAERFLDDRRPETLLQTHRLRFHPATRAWLDDDARLARFEPVRTARLRALRARFDAAVAPAPAAAETAPRGAL